MCVFTSYRKRVFEDLPIEKPKEDEEPNFGFELRPRTIQAGTYFKLICHVQAHPVPKVRRGSRSLKKRRQKGHGVFLLTVKCSHLRIMCFRYLFLNSLLLPRIDILTLHITKTDNAALHVLGYFIAVCLLVLYMLSVCL